MSLALVPGQEAQTVVPSDAPATVNGVLQPPPDIKSIVDKTAQFVARNGPEFEQRILYVGPLSPTLPLPPNTSPRLGTYPPPHPRHSTLSEPLGSPTASPLTQL